MKILNSLKNYDLINNVYFIVLSYFPIKFSIKYLDQEIIERVREFEQANDFYLPIYLGYVFVAISLLTLRSLYLLLLYLYLIRI